MKKTIDYISLDYSVTTSPDFGGFRFYVREGSLFDLSDYAEAYGLNIHEISQQDAKAVGDAAGNLQSGQWIEVTHTVHFIDHETE